VQRVSRGPPQKASLRVQCESRPGKFVATLVDSRVKEDHERSRSKLKWVRVNFTVNDLEFEAVLMRPCERDPTDLELVIEHRFLGSFALYEEFFLERRENGCAGGWRPMSLEKLKLASLEGSRNDRGVTRERRRPLGGVKPRCGRQSANIPRIPVEGDAGHFRPREGERSSAEKSATRASAA
jgi:hypothetical protein